MAARAAVCIHRRACLAIVVLPCWLIPRARSGHNARLLAADNARLLAADTARLLAADAARPAVPRRPGDAVVLAWVGG
jgi:hypothetical protein